jgi:hypothetical protein
MIGGGDGLLIISIAQTALIASPWNSGAVHPLEVAIFF